MSIAVQIRAEAESSPPPLSALEWKVVGLAMREAGEAGGDGTRRGWFGRWIDSGAGLRPRLPLADPRLETLRRFVCGVRDHRGDVSELQRRMLEQGFHPGQISALAMIAR